MIRSKHAGWVALNIHIRSRRVSKKYIILKTQRKVVLHIHNCSMFKTRSAEVYNFFCIYVSVIALINFLCYVLENSFKVSDIFLFIFRGIRLLHYSMSFVRDVGYTLAVLVPCDTSVALRSLLEAVLIHAVLQLLLHSHKL